MCAPFHAADSAPEHTIRLHFDDRPPVPPEAAQHDGAVWRWQSGAERHLLEQYGAPGKPPQFTYALTRGAHTELTFANAYRAGASVRAVLEAAGLFDIFADLGMLVLHSAYIVTSAGEAILFSGPSGVGKSTQAALWERCAGARVVNGDRALVDGAKRPRTAFSIRVRRAYPKTSRRPSGRSSCSVRAAKTACSFRARGRRLRACSASARITNGTCPRRKK